MTWGKHFGLTITSRDAGEEERRNRDLDDVPRSQPEYDRAHEAQVAYNAKMKEKSDVGYTTPNAVLALSKEAGLNGDGPATFVVMNTQNALTGLLTQEEAERFASRAVNGQIPPYAGITELFICEVKLVARVTDRRSTNVQIDRVALPPKVVSSTSETIEQ